MIWETRVIVYRDVKAETYEEACALAKKIFEAGHSENFEVDAYPSPFDWMIEEAKYFKPGRYVEDIMAANP